MQPQLGMRVSSDGRPEPGSRDEPDDVGQPRRVDDEEPLRRIDRAAAAIYAATGEREQDRPLETRWRVRPLRGPSRATRSWRLRCRDNAPDVQRCQRDVRDKKIDIPERDLQIYEASRTLRTPIPIVNSVDLLILQSGRSTMQMLPRLRNPTPEKCNIHTGNCATFCSANATCRQTFNKPKASQMSVCNSQCLSSTTAARAAG